MILSSSHVFAVRMSSGPFHRSGGVPRSPLASRLKYPLRTLNGPLSSCAATRRNSLFASLEIRASRSLSRVAMYDARTSDARATKTLNT